MSTAKTIVASVGLVALGFAGGLIALFGLLSRSYGAACSGACSDPTGDCLTMLGAGIVLLAVVGLVGVVALTRARRRSHDIS